MKTETVAVEEAKEREAFLERRKCGIGGSDVAPILGISKWSTPLDVYNSKLGLTPPSEETDAMYWGTTLEKVVADEFAKRTGKKVQVRNKQYQHPEHECLVANIDRYIVGEKAILECKTSNSFTAKQWDEGIPLYYLTQVMHYMSVTGYRKGYLAVLIGGIDFRIFDVEYDEELANMLIEKCLNFWNNHVVPHVPPAPINLDDIKKLYGHSNGESVVAPAEIEELYRELVELKSIKKDTEKEMKELQFGIQKFLQDNEVLLSNDGKKLATWKASTTNRFDTKRFKVEHPELYSKFVKSSESRRFLIK